MIEEDASIFREQQKFSPWLRSVLVFSVPITVAVLVFAGATQGIIGQPSFILSSLAGIVLMLAIAGLFWNLRLETEVRADGLYVRFFPFHLRCRKFTPQELSEHYARQYRPLLEYGGWGIKYGRKGKAYNVSGNRGVQLVFKDGKQLLIGSQRAEELAEAISSIAITP
jgi:hypothetical protein